MTDNRRYTPITLDCEHTLWFRPNQKPQPGDVIWCRHCKHETTVKARPEYGAIEGDWRSIKTKRGLWKGMCGKCPYITPGRHSWYAVEKEIYGHMLRAHSSIGGHNIVIERHKTPSDPPF